MSGGSTQRRLAAILSADVVDYSGHMARDDAATLRAMRTLRERVRSSFGAAGGRVVDAVGDGFLAEFPSVVTAAEAAAGLTSALRSAATADPDALELRIGIHVGDILEDDERRIYGDAVNVSARVMALADPGAVFLSSAAQSHLGRREGLATRYVGEFEVKNVASAVAVHRIVDRDPDARDGEARAATKRAPGSAIRLEDWEGLPAVAVLPFDNMSSDPDQEFLADGLVEDLITALSCSRWFSVIARNSSFVYKGKPISIPEVSRDLGARYIVEGSIRRSGSRVRVTGQLIDGTTGAHVWAERYDRELDDLFDLQDELTLAITGALIPSVQGAERSRAMAKSPKNLGAWECLHRGIWYLGHFTAEDQRQAQALFERATELAPRWGLPFAAQAWSCVVSITFELTDDVVATLQSGMRLAERAVTLSPNDVEAQHALGWTSTFARQYDAAKKAFERGLELNPSAAGCYHGIGYVQSMCDRPEEALEPLKRSILLSPQDPQLHFRRGHLGQVYLQLGRHDEAIEEVHAAIALRQDYGFFYLLAAALGLSERLDEGRAVLREAAAKFPNNRVEGLRAFLSPTLYALHRTGLERLGLGLETGVAE